MIKFVLIAYDLFSVSYFIILILKKLKVLKHKKTKFIKTPKLSELKDYEFNDYMDKLIKDL